MDHLVDKNFNKQGDGSMEQMDEISSLILKSVQNADMQAEFMDTRGVIVDNYASKAIFETKALTFPIVFDDEIFNIGLDARLFYPQTPIAGDRICEDAKIVIADAEAFMFGSATDKDTRDRYGFIGSLNCPALTSYGLFVPYEKEGSDTLISERNAYIAAKMIEAIINNEPPQSKIDTDVIHDLDNIEHKFINGND